MTTISSALRTTPANPAAILADCPRVIAKLEEAWTSREFITAQAPV
ncbi:hypothetical protein [Mycolicibacterium fortuitum]|nr:hypothetical protein [Mycolicibacterium fortuitum]